MRMVFRVGLVGFFCATVAASAVVALTTAKERAMVWRLFVRHPRTHSTGFERSRTPIRDRTTLAMPLFSSGGFDLAGYPTACRFTGPIQDRGSLDQTRDAIRSRSQRGNAALRAQLAMASGSPDAALRAFVARSGLADLAMYEGAFSDSAAWLEQALAEGNGVPRDLLANHTALLGVVHLRRGETENCLDCLGPSSCIFPIAAEAVHQRPSGSREAIRHFTEYLGKRPEDLGVRWLLNVAYMTLGEYPSHVPPQYLIPVDRFQSKLDAGRFVNVATRVGLGRRPANMAGGAVFDDFTGDGLPDLLISSLDVDLGASLFANLGDGMFEDRTEQSGLAQQPLALNAKQADFDNDGRLDVVLLRGGWETPYRLSLLRNKGEGVFEDVTARAGVSEPIASQSAAWADFDNDGWVDLFVCGEYARSTNDGLVAASGTVQVADPRNRCRLYRNRGDGTFVDVADRAGVRNDRFAKGAVWGDYDRDGFADLYVSNYGADNRLYHNRGDGTFEDVAAGLGVTCAYFSFSCWFWDFDNDGRLDLFVNQYGGSLQDAVASMLGRPTNPRNHPHLFRNLGSDGFREISSEMGLSRVMLAMGSNFGDIDNDGYLDFYLATGQPGYAVLLPNLMFKNVAGRRFEDITVSSGTGHLQKGHETSFGDWDGDGDLDLFVQTGGAAPGDRAFNLLFENPGHGRHWIKLKLVGTSTNRAALGARLRAEIKAADGTIRAIYREIGGGSSYGGSSLVEHIGLGDALSIAALTVNWPTSGTQQTFRDLAADALYEVTEGTESIRVVHLPAAASGARSDGRAGGPGRR